MKSNINNNDSISYEEHATLVSERTASVKCGRSESPEDTGVPLDACGIRELAESFTSLEPWQAIPARVLRLRPVEGDAQKEFDGHLEGLQKQLTLMADYFVWWRDTPLSLELFRERLTQLLDKVLSCISTTPLPAEEPQHAPSVIAVFGQHPTKYSVHSQLASYPTIEEWRKAIKALAFLKPTKGHEVCFGESLLTIMLRCREPLDSDELMRLAKEFLAFTQLPGTGLTLANFVQKRREQGFVSELTKAFNIERVMTSSESPERSRIVDVAATACNTQTIRAISDSIRCKGKPALVVTGESGSGKTVGAMVGATTCKGCFAVYLGTPPSIPAPKESDAADDANAKTDEALAKSLTAMLLFSTGLDLTNESHRLTHDPQTSLSIILDELGDRRHVLRSFLRLARSNRFVEAIKLTFGVTSVSFIAVGTGCHDSMCPAGSRPDSYATVYTGSCDGRAVWRRLVEVNYPLLRSPDPLAPYIFTLVGGLDVTGAFGSVLDSVVHHPEGYVFAATGRTLVGNARVAALLMRALVGLLSEIGPSVIPISAPALIECSLPFVRSLHHVAIHQFVVLSGLANFPSNIERMECVAKALALTLAGTDAEISHEMFLELCAKKGVLTSHAIEVDGDTPPQGGRTFGDGRWVVPDAGRRYRVTGAVASMYLMSFGAVRRPARTGEAFELLVFEYVTLALAPASIVAEWSRIEKLKPLSLPAPGIARFGLFDLLVDAFTESKVKMGRMLTLMLPSKFEPSSYDCSKKRKAGGKKRKAGGRKRKAGSGIWTLEDVWDALGPEADEAPAEGTPVAIVLNADKASGPDMMVLCPGHFAIHLQLKLNQTSMMASGDMNCEFVKMGAGDAQGGKGAAACDNARQCIEASKSMFPRHYFAIVRCVAPAAGARFTHTIPDHKGCRYIQVTAGHSDGPLSDAFYPLASVPTTQTAAALCTPCCYPFKHL